MPRTNLALALVEGKKPCGRCRKVKPLDDFYANATKADGRCSACKVCRRSDDQKLKDRPVQQTPAAKWRKFDRVIAAYGLSRSDWDEMLISQSGRCAACGEPFRNARGEPHVDHCHETGRVRGILCRGCNYAEGTLQGDPAPRRRPPELHLRPA